MTYLIIHNDADIPNSVLIDMVRTGKIPIFEPGTRWLDERVGCKYARCDDMDGAAHCPMLATPASARPYCRLNGPARRSPCVFGEPEDAPVWERIREQQEIEARIEAESREAMGK